MTEAPLLAKPSPEDTLYLYLSISEQAVSAVLVKEERKLQKPVHYVSKVLHGAELNYSTTEKFALALITASRKLRPYFQAHKIETLTDQPLRNILHSPKASGRLMKWAIELGEFDIKYKPRRAIKAQALADFMVECNINYQEVGGQEIVCGDSRLVVAQVNGEFEDKNDIMAKYPRVVKGILTQFDEWYAEHIPREENTTEDALSQFASSEIENYSRSIYFQVLKTHTIHVINLISPVGMASCWIDPIKTHLETGWLPDDAREARKILANGKAEVTNRIILDGIKKRVERSKNTWVDELLPILWAYRTTCKVTNEATAFMLAYGAEAVVPLKITHRSPRIEAYEPEINEEGMRLALDLIDEVRDEANDRNTEHQRRASLYYNGRVNERFFQ
ncbi:uncharacterized protein LOC141691954 [Apium graveolens]|uniref:uncharacterized protein LOC141691954 n=1 Tax=Apium graveolens TaxID=4045 RepID=UPI003D7B2C1A